MPGDLPEDFDRSPPSLESLRDLDHARLALRWALERIENIGRERDEAKAESARASLSSRVERALGLQSLLQLRRLETGVLRRMSGVADMSEARMRLTAETRTLEAKLAARRAALESRRGDPDTEKALKELAEREEAFKQWDDLFREDDEARNAQEDLKTRLRRLERSVATGMDPAGEAAGAAPEAEGTESAETQTLRRRLAQAEADHAAEIARLKARLSEQSDGETTPIVRLRHSLAEARAVADAAAGAAAQKRLESRAADLEREHERLRERLKEVTKTAGELRGEFIREVRQRETELRTLSDELARERQTAQEKDLNLQDALHWLNIEARQHLEAQSQLREVQSKLRDLEAHRNLRAGDAGALATENEQLRAAARALQTKLDDALTVALRAGTEENEAAAHWKLKAAEFEAQAAELRGRLTALTQAQAKLEASGREAEAQRAELERQLASLQSVPQTIPASAGPQTAPADIAPGDEAGKSLQRKIKLLEFDLSERAKTIEGLETQLKEAKRRLDKYESLPVSPGLPTMPPVTNSVETQPPSNPDDLEASASRLKALLETARQERDAARAELDRVRAFAEAESPVRSDEQEARFTEALARNSAAAAAIQRELVELCEECLRELEDG